MKSDLKIQLDLRFYNNKGTKMKNEEQTKTDKHTTKIQERLTTAPGLKIKILSKIN